MQNQWIQMIWSIHDTEPSLDDVSQLIIDKTWYDDFLLKNMESEYHYVNHDDTTNYYCVSQLYFCELKSLYQRVEFESHESWSITRLTIDEIRKLDNPVIDYCIDRVLWIVNNDHEYIDRYNAYHPHPDKSKWISHLIPHDELPVVLPLDLPNYKPAGKSPLEDHPTFKYYHAADGNTYLRECDTLDTFMCSSFYYLRFLDPKNPNQLIADAHNMPVDLYIWGKEHIVWHLLYSRFIYKFLKNNWYIDCESSEPFVKLVHQWIIHGPDGRKMSKRWWNVIDPRAIIDQYGVDTLRCYLMFMWPVELNKNRNPDAVQWMYRFLQRVYNLIVWDIVPSITARHQTIKWVTHDIENFKFNTALSKLMIFSNILWEQPCVHHDDLDTLLSLLAPFAPELASSRWQNYDTQSRPQYDENLCHNTTINLPIQINGKTRWQIQVSADVTRESIVQIVNEHPVLAKYIQWDIQKIIYVPQKICNFIIWH